MSYGYGGKKMGMMHAGLAGGYSYATLTSSMDPPSDGYDARFGRSRIFPRHQSFSAGRPRIDRRYSPPPTRHRCDAGPSSSAYTSLHSGLTLPRTAVGKSGHSHHRDKEKERDHQHRAAESSRKPHGDHSRRPAPPPTRPSAKHSYSHHTSKSRRDSKVASDGKRHSTQLIHPPRPASPRRKSTTGAKKHSHDDKATCSGRHSTTSNRTKGTSNSRTRSISSKKSASRKSRKPKSKGMFGWGCFGM